jgi:ATP-dependent DNA helicase RecQ
VHNDFLNDKINIVVATTAFGMGIDKPNIRHVVHWGAPKTLESYYQQSGRAGRDGMESRCTLIHSGQDFVLGSFYEKSAHDGQLISQVARDALHEGLSKMKIYCHLTACRRAYLLSYFGEQLPAASAANCGRCDNCHRSTSAKEAGKQLERDVQERARELLSAVWHCKQSYGMGGAKPVEYWKELANQLLTISPPYLVEESRVGNAGGYQQTFKIVKISPLGLEWLQAVNSKMIYIYTKMIYTQE